jgi:type VI secretion system protein ImpG
LPEETLTNLYFQSELNTLKDHAPEFFRTNPALAPFLDGNKTDPDVERLLEAIAYQIALFRRKLDVDFPELINKLFRLILPHYLQPIPASTTISFTLENGCGEIVLIPTGTQVTSAPVDGTPIPFTTTCDVEVHPLELTDAIFIQQPGRTGQIRLSLVLNNTSLSRWQPKELRIFLPGDRATAGELFLLLNRHVTRIILTPLEGGAGIELPADCLTSAGLAENAPLLSYPSQAYPVYRQLQEYFNAPEKFFSFVLTGWEQWINRGEGVGFTISFEVSDLPLGHPTIRRESFALNCAHAVNTFSHQAYPITIDHRASTYLVRPAGANPAHFQVFSVDDVTGYRRETREERSYQPFELFSQDNATEPLYHAVQEKSQHGNGLDVHMSVVFPGEIPEAHSETLSIDITCTNGTLPENLHIGDICLPVSELPETLSFRNITAITPALLPPLGSDLLQRLTTHISLDLLSLECVEHLRTLLELYIFPDNRSGSSMAANLKRISGIESIRIIPDEQIVVGIPMRGREIRIRIRQDHFAGAGDMYLFGCVLDHFFGGYASGNTYTRLTFNETTRGITCQWPMRLGHCNHAGLVFKPGPVASTTNKPPPQPANVNTRRIESNDKNNTIPSLIDDLLSLAHEFNFPQVMRLLRKALSPDGIPELPEIPWQERVRVRPDLSLTFPAADVARIERTGQGNATFLVTNTFGGLYGSSSPLPSFYTEDLMDEASNDLSISRDFLDILHQRLFYLFFQCWSKYRLFIRIAEEKSLPDMERLASLLGMGVKELRDSVPESRPLLRYTGLFIHTVRSALGLQTLLRDALGVTRLEVEQCVLRTVPIPADQRMSLGISGMSLGVNTVLGSVAYDRMGKICINIGPLKKKGFDSFLPGTPLYDKLMRLIRLYVYDPFVFELKLILAANEAVPIRLGDPGTARLGLGTWSFSSKTLGEVSVTFTLSSWLAEPSPAVAGFDRPPEQTEEPTFVECYQDEMRQLRDLSASCVETHEELAPLVSGHMADPGVERLFEGTAFQFARLRQTLDDDFPEVIHELTEALHPWDLRPKPAMTIVAFTPKTELKQSLLIPAGAEVASIPVQGTRCRFKTCFDVTVHPLTLLEASFSQPSGKAPSITLQCELNGIGLSGWKAKSLRFFLGNEYPAACDLYLLLTRYLKRITITSPDNGATVEIPSACLKPAGFADDETILTKETSFMPGHLALQEYFLFHDKYLFMVLTGLDTCSTLGNGSRFEINFELTASLPVIPQVNDKSFVFFASPVINLFPHKAMPISFISDLHQHVILPEHPGHHQLYSVEQVSGMLKNRLEKIKYGLQNSSHQRSKDGYTCHITRCKSSFGNGFDTFLSVPRHENETETDRIKLDIDLICTNGTLPEQLNIGDVCTTTTTTPEFVEPRNIKKITAASFQGTQHNRQWKLLSGFSLNSVSLNGVDNFRAILRLFIDSSSRNQLAVIANTKKIDAIESINAKPGDRLIGRSVYRGYEISLRLRGSHFEGLGDLYLFCSVLERFLGGYVTQNCFVRLTVEEIGKGYCFEWPTRFGDRCVL